MIHGLYAITNDRLMPGELLFEKSRAALEGGCKILQYRNKTLPPHLALEKARRLKTLCDEFSASLIINDSIELAKAVNAGVHLGQSDDAITRARQVLGEGAIIGATCHNQLGLAHKAIGEGASYVAFGRFFPSSTKPSASPADISLLEEINRLPVPNVVIGGINADNATSLISAGARCIAVSEAVFGCDQLSQVTQSAARLSQIIPLP
ncbi:thiamine phosphate synthase [Aurantivibrio plasticivorans]